VRLLNQHFTALSKDGAFATAVVATFFEPTRRMTLCNAGHPRPLLYSAARKRWDFLGSDIPDPPGTKVGPSDLPLGLLDISEYSQFDVELEPGDRVLTYTDALMESNDASGEMLGEKGVLQILRLVGDVEPQELIRNLLSEIADRDPENLTQDDVTVVLVQVNDQKESYTVGEKLGALLRFTGSLIRSLNPRAERAPFPDWNLANVGGAIVPALGRRWRAKPTSSALP
jgi:sigma-B regulation protein RsbU (phosphoserine phosphatase)